MKLLPGTVLLLPVHTDKFTKLKSLICKFLTLLTMEILPLSVFEYEILIRIQL
jgi:hypothetical protein